MYICSSYDRDTDIHAMGHHRAECAMCRHVEDRSAGYYADDSPPVGYGIRGKGVDRNYPADALYGRYYSCGIL